MDDDDVREKAYKYVVFSSIGFSVIATISAGLTLFMANSSVANFEHKMYKDVVFCKVSTEFLLNSVFSLKVSSLFMKDSTDDVFREINLLRQIEQRKTNRTLRQSYPSPGGGYGPGPGPNPTSQPGGSCQGEWR